MRKIFNHDFVLNRVELKRMEIDGVRYYEVPGGEKYKSVTTILGEKIPNPALDAWKARIGEEEAKKISEQAARRGTAVHELAERYVANEEKYIKGAMPANVSTFMSLRKMLDKHVDNIKGIELQMYSHILKTAGTSDLIAEYDGVLSVIDYKTSKKLKQESWIQNYFIQSTVYALMFKELYNTPIDQIVIAIAVDHESEPQVFVKDISSYTEKVFELFC